MHPVSQNAYNVRIPRPIAAVNIAVDFRALPPLASASLSQEKKFPRLYEMADRRWQSIW